jgi:tetratricopeptide (TPR) repeat protein
MGWRFWKRKTAVETTEAADEAVEQLDSGELEVAEVSERAEAPRFHSFSFEKPPPLPPEADTAVVRSTTISATEEAPHVRIERVVRNKAAGRRAGIDLRARGVSPVWVPGLREIAMSYRLAAEARADDPAGAREFWNAYLELCPEDGEAWFAYGQILLGERRFEQAWTAFESARRAQPDDGLSAGALGFLSQIRGDAVAAVTWYAEAARLRPGCRDMLGSLADAQDAAGRPSDAARTRAEIERLEAQ